MFYTAPLTTPGTCTPSLLLTPSSSSTSSGVFGRWFPELSLLMWESDFSALLSDGVVSGRGGRGSCGSGCWCTVFSRRRSCCPGCGRWEVRWCGNDQQGDDMTDQMTDSFRRTKTIQCDLSIEPWAMWSVLVRRLLYVMHAVGVYSVYTTRRIVGTAFRQSGTPLSCMLCESNILFWKKKKTFTAHHHILKNATTKNSIFAKRNSAMMKTTKTKFAASLPALYTTSILSSDQSRSHNLHVIRIVNTDFDVFVCSGGSVYRAVLLLPWTRLAVADILVEHCGLLFVIVLFPISVLHRLFLSCLNHQMKELQTNLRRPSSWSSLR